MLYYRTMFYRIFFILLIAFFVVTSQLRVVASTKPDVAVHYTQLARQEMSLEKRYSNKMVNDVFKDNILLTIAYMSGKVTDAKSINWDEVRTPFVYDVQLAPGEVFAFHDDVKPEYRGKSITTTHANFNASGGFKSDGYLYGDGVCHLASLINWAAADAGLKVLAPTNHNFAVVPEVPREYGTSIYYSPGESAANQMQNLYVENNTGKTVHMIFRYDGEKLSVAIAK